MSGAISREPSLAVWSTAFASARRSLGSIWVRSADWADVNRYPEAPYTNVTT